MKNINKNKYSDLLISLINESFEKVNLSYNEEFDKLSKNNNIKLVLYLFSKWMTYNLVEIKDDLKFSFDYIFKSLDYFEERIKNNFKNFEKFKFSKKDIEKFSKYFSEKIDIKRKSFINWVKLLSVENQKTCY